MAEKKARYEAIDGLRAISAAGIVMMHVLTNGGCGAGGFIFNRLIPSFTNLVFLFMVVSGFSVCCGYYDKVMSGTVSFETFYKRRFGKILPFFGLMCIFDLIFSPSLGSLYEMLASLTLCFGLLPDAGNMSVVGVGWFVGVVFVFYMVFPFYCFLLANRRRAWLSLAAAFIMNLLAGGYFGVGRTNILFSAVYFLAGGVIFLYRDKLTELSGKYGWAVLLLAAAAAVTYYIAGSRTVVMAVLFSLLLIYALGRSGGVLCGRGMKFLGGISMEVYLCHMAIFRVLEKMGLIHLFRNEVLSYAFAVVITAAGAIVFSKIMQVVIGKGMTLLSDRKGSKKNG